MAYDGFDNINQLHLQAAIEAEIDLFENSGSRPTYTTMEGFTFQPNMLDQQQQLQPNMLVQQQQFQQQASTYTLATPHQAATPTISPLQEHVIGTTSWNY